MVTKPLWREGWANSVYTLQVRTDWVGFQLTMQHWVFMSKPFCMVGVYPNSPFQEVIPTS